MKNSQALLVFMGIYMVSHAMHTQVAQQDKYSFCSGRSTHISNDVKRPTPNQTCTFSHLEHYMETRGDLVALGLIGCLTANLITYIAIHLAAE